MKAFKAITEFGLVQSRICPNYGCRGHIIQQKSIRDASTTLTTPQGSITSITRYQFDDSGVLQSTNLPDGSQVAYERNGQGQLVAVKRERILTSWLRWAAPAQTLVKDLQRDLVGLKRYTTGNGIEATFLRSKDGSLARVSRILCKRRLS